MQSGKESSIEVRRSEEQLRIVDGPKIVHSENRVAVLRSRFVETDRSPGAAPRVKRETHYQ